MSWRVLVSAPYMLPVLDEFMDVLKEHDIEVIRADVNERLSEEELLPLMADIDGVICGDDRFTERVFQAAPKLKVISKWGTGIDSIDPEAAEKHGVKVCNTPGAFTDPVADTVMGYVLAFARQFPWLDRDIRAGKWQKRMGVSLHERTLGVVGVGDVGKAVISRAIAFGMTVLGTDIVPVPESFVQSTGLKVVSLDELLAESDYVSLNCTLNPTSNHLISDDQLERMKDTACLINTCRGSVVDEAALGRALLAGKIAGAGLDVFEDEPLPEDSPLRTLDSCLLAPHNANSSPEAWQRVHVNTLHNLISVLEGAG